MLHTDQAADAGQREAERQLDRRELSEDQQQQREAGLGMRVENRDRLDVDREHLEFQDARVAVFVDHEIAAALDDSDVEREPDPVRRLERERDRCAAAEVELEQDAQAIHRRREGAERHAERCGYLDGKPGEAAAHRIESQIDELQFERAGGQRGHRQARAEPGAIDEAQLAGGIGLGGDVQRDGDAIAQDQLEEAVVGLDHRLRIVRDERERRRAVRELQHDT